MKTLSRWIIYITLAWAMVLGSIYAARGDEWSDFAVPMPEQNFEKIERLAKWGDPHHTRWGWLFFHWIKGERWMTSFNVCNGTMKSNPFSTYNVDRDILYRDNNEDGFVDQILWNGADKPDVHECAPPCKGG